LLTASAGYWLAAQATTLNVGESARSGSIGVYMVHDEISGMMEKEGVKRTYIYEGDRKVLGNEAEPLSADAKKYFQAEVSREMQSFVDAVATGRGVDESTVRGESFGQGQTVPADAALAAGMVDSVGTLSQAMQELSQAAAGTRNTAQDLAIMERSLALLQLRSKAKC